MRERIKGLPHKTLALIGVILLIIGFTLPSINMWLIIIKIILLFFSGMFIVDASHKRLSEEKNNKR